MPERPTRFIRHIPALLIYLKVSDLIYLCIVLTITVIFYYCLKKQLLMEGSLFTPVFIAVCSESDNSALLLFTVAFIHKPRFKDLQISGSWLDFS